MIEQSQSPCASLPKASTARDTADKPLLTLNGSAQGHGKVAKDEQTTRTLRSRRQRDRRQAALSTQSRGAREQTPNEHLPT